jgi:hypothetical protein
MARPEIQKALRARRSLNIHRNYGDPNVWHVKSGVREILQNFWDGLLQKDDEEIRKPSDINIVEVTTRGKALSFTAYDRRKQTATNKGEEIGYIKYTPGKKLEVVNRGVALKRTHLLMGKTSKGGGRNTIGIHGEGMKIGGWMILPDSQVFFSALRSI